MALSWELDSGIMSKVASTEAFISYLAPLLTRIVAPMERQIRELLFIFRQHTEAALFASDLHFHISGATTDDITNSLSYLKPDSLNGQKPQEALLVLNMRLHAMIDKFKALFQDFID